MHRLTIRTDGPNGNKGQVLLDGEPLRRVKRIEFATGVGEFTHVKIELFAQVDVEADADPDKLTVE